jgi:L-galactose dehydrogenase/L-glyceraldehyde 3-phosphate reductase
MQYRILGRTGLEVSVVGLGAGPVPALMTGGDGAAQRAVVARALEAGINWFDTAPGYGDGKSEANLGQALRDLGASDRVHVATKVRLAPGDLADVEAAVRRSLAGSLARLGLSAVTLLQLHNGITARRGDVPASLTPADVLGPGGVRAAFECIRGDGLARFVGLTGTGEPAALAAVLDSGAFDTIQVPHHLLAPADAGLLRCCRERGVGVLAIRVFAGGALLGQPPSAHTLRTPYFPLALYEEDRRRAAALEAALGGEMAVKELAVRFALSDPAVQVALVGLAAPEQVDEAVALAGRGPLPGEWFTWRTTMEGKRWTSP